jgi:uncharacterized protein (TIGR02231 family)
MISRTCIPVLSIVWLASASASAAQPAPIDRVVVFADRAEISRVTDGVCKDGKAEVAFPMLPVSLDARTLRAEAGGKAEAIGVSSRVIPLEKDLDKRVAATRDELQKLYDRINEMSDRAAGLNEQSGLVASFAHYFAILLNEEMRNEKPDPARWGKVLDSIRAERLSGARKRAELTVTLRDLRRKQERLERRLANLRPRDAAEARLVTVAVECRGETRPKVTLSYVVPGATWHPEYDLRFVPAGKNKVGKGRAELTVAAVIQQATGEDWVKAKVVLSTSKPRLGSEAPWPAPLYLDGYEVSDKKVLVASMEKRDQLRGPGGSTAATPRSVSIEDKGQSFALTLPRRVSIMADGRPYWMPVDVVLAKAEAKLMTIPKLKPYVYQVATFKNPAPYPLIAGLIHAHRGTSYVGDTRLDYTAPGEPMEVSLGIDEEIKVERKDLREMEKDASFLSSTKHLERSYRIKVNNRSAGRQGVEVRENIPVSKTEEVEVELVKDKTSPNYRLDSHRGFISWIVHVDPAQEKAVDLAYTIHLPEEWEVQVR